MVDLKERAERLAAQDGHEGPVITLTLDLSRSRLPPETRVFLKGRVQKELRGEALRAPLRRILRYVEEEVRPALNGIYIAAGRGVWEVVETQVALRNFVTVGRAPYVAPLLEMESRFPRAYVVRMQGGVARVEELHVGESRVVEEAAAVAPKENLEGVPTRRSGGRGIRPGISSPGRGGSERDSHERRRKASLDGLARVAGGVVESNHRVAPAAAILFFGDHERYEEFLGRLSVSVRARASWGTGDASVQIEKLVRGRMEAEIREVQERRREGCGVALGPREVWEALIQGLVSRVCVDPENPVPGALCATCGARFEGLPERCAFCLGTIEETSLTQEVLAHALAHPPLAVTFVRGAPWLRDLGGMCGLLSAKGVRRRTALPTR